MVINAYTRIAPILKQDARALEAIISLSPRFEKLRNPLLRKVMAGRTTLEAASKMGGCRLEELFEKLEPLGFEVNRNIEEEGGENKPVPAFISSLREAGLVELDVRPVIASGSDPLQQIMENVKSIQKGQILKIINSFEPTPLINLLEKKGFETYVDTINDNHVETYFHKKSNRDVEEKTVSQQTDDWDSILQKFGNRIREIDVRQLEMPQPMHTILDELDRLPADTALFVFHKRIPVFLLPELLQRGFDYRIKEISEGQINLLIFKN